MCFEALGKRPLGDARMNSEWPENERRKWTRLPLAIPVFVRGRDDQGKEFLEFATALNVGAGGMLVAIRRVLPPVAKLRLEIPSAPIASLGALPGATRTLRARTLRMTPAQGYYMVGLKFSRPLLLAQEPARKKKALSVV